MIDGSADDGTMLGKPGKQGDRPRNLATPLFYQACPRTLHRPIPKSYQLLSKSEFTVARKASSSNNDDPSLFCCLVRSEEVQ